jgi:hypothetical protein
MRVVVSVLLLASLAIVCAQDNETAPFGCSCQCCGDNGCEVYGAFPLNTCGDCDTAHADIECPKYFPDQCQSGHSYSFECGAVDLNDDWAGDWVVDPCSACLLDAAGEPVGDCIPCCDAGFCDCIYGTITINDIAATLSDGVTQIQILTSGTSSATTTNIGNETGFLGTTAYFTVSTTSGDTYDTYDLIKHGDALQLKSRWGASCNINATRNPATTSMLKLALLLGGVGIGVLACVIFCCCNPCKKKKDTKTDPKLLGEGQEGVPYQQVSEGGINYTGEQQTK